MRFRPISPFNSYAIGDRFIVTVDGHGGIYGGGGGEDISWWDD